MAVGRKPDLEPLLPPGRHTRTLDELYALAVAPFRDASSGRREKLYLSLESLIQELLVKNIPCDVVVNGSFLTRKEDPADIDIKIYLSDDVIMNLNYDQDDFINKLNQSECFDGLDVVCYPLYSLGSKMKGSALDPLVDGEMYGLENGQYYLKGYVTIPVCETYVGLRIRR